MGYQEVAIKVRVNENANKKIQEIEETAKALHIEQFIWLLGSYNKGEQVKYLVYGTDRHPGADLLKEVYKEACLDMDVVYEELEECYTYNAIEEN